MTKIKKYRLLNNRINIVYKDKVLNEDGDWIYGICKMNGSETVIQVSTLDKDGNPMLEEDIECTVRHELFHTILDSLYFSELSNNETLVEWLASATHELNKQGLKI